MSWHAGIHRQGVLSHTQVCASMTWRHTFETRTQKVYGRQQAPLINCAFSAHMRALPHAALNVAYLEGANHVPSVAACSMDCNHDWRPLVRITLLI